MIRNMFGGASKSRTIDKVDIFGDSSGVALYQLDGNANNTGGVYHGTEVTGITYGGGVYERGVIVNLGKIDLGAGSKVLMPHNGSYSISAWIYNTGTAIRRIIAGRMNASVGTGYGDYFVYEYDNTLKFNKIYAGVGGSIESLVYTPVYTIGWHHIVISFDRGANIANMYSDGILVATKSNWNTGTYDNNLNTLIGAFHNENTSAYQDQLRFFNRAITATEVATLYAECAPTSTVDNINPFMDGSMKALYQFNGDATDATDVYNGTATNVTYGVGKYGQCAVFNGGALISTSFALSANVFSYSGWFKVATPSSTIQSLIDFTTNRAMLSSGNGTNAYMSYYDGGTYRTFSTYTLPANTFVFLSLVINGTTAYLYANGVLKGTSTCTAIVPSGGMYLGRYAGSAGGFLTGSQDQVRIFNKALTPLEVASLYNETTPLEEPMYKLVDPFRDGSGKALYRLEGNALDESGNYNGTATSVTYGTGQFGRCAVFNGSSSVVSQGGLTGGTIISSSFWMKTTSTTNQTPLCFTSGLFEGNYLTTTTTTGKLVYATKSSGSSTASTTTVTDGQWHHIYIERNTSTYKLVIDNSETISGSLPKTTGTLEVGAYRASDAFIYFMLGSIDQVRHFNRPLTATEVTKLYTGENDVL